MGFELVGRSWDTSSFREFVKTQDLSWAKGITIHHTGTPDLGMRPNGLTAQHMRNIQHYYQNTKGWSAGPHLFADDDQILGMSSLERRGVHAMSFNRTHLGIEILGNYNQGKDDRYVTRGSNCWRMGLTAVAILIRESHLQVYDVNFHRDDPRTSKECPGKTISKAKTHAEIQGILNDLDPLQGEEGDDLDSNDRVDFDEEETIQTINAMQWQLDKLKKQLGI